MGKIFYHVLHFSEKDKANLWDLIKELKNDDVITIHYVDVDHILVMIDKALWTPIDT